MGNTCIPEYNKIKNKKNKNKIKLEEKKKISHPKEIFFFKFHVYIR